MIRLPFWQRFLERAPDDRAPGITIAPRVTHRIHVGPELETVEDNATCLGHVFLGGPDSFLAHEHVARFAL